MCLNERKWFSFRSSHYYPIVNSCHEEPWAPILKGYSSQYLTMCHLCWNDSEEQRFPCTGYFCFSVLLHAGLFKHPLVNTSHNGSSYLLFLHSNGYVKWNVIREITQAFIFVVVRRNLKLVKNLNLTFLVDTFRKACLCFPSRLEKVFNVI